MLGSRAANADTLTKISEGSSLSEDLGQSASRDLAVTSGFVIGLIPNGGAVYFEAGACTPERPLSVRRTPSFERT